MPSGDAYLVLRSGPVQLGDHVVWEVAREATPAPARADVL